MIYQTGTITTTAGQTKIKGTGTRWKDNLAGISEGCPISYLINNVVYMNTVLSVNSDTEINLTYPVPVAASAVKYQIATFVLDSMSDGVRKMLANQQYIQYFLRNMDTWLTQDGIVEIKTPTGETVRLESIIALKKLIDGKMAVGANGLGASPSGNTQPVTYKDADKLEANGFYAASGGDAINFAQLYSAILVMTRQGGSDNSGMVDQLQLGNGRIYGRSRTGMKWSGWMSPIYPGDYGLAGSGPYRGGNGDVDFFNIVKERKTQVFRTNTSTTYQYAYGPTFLISTGEAWASFCVHPGSGNVVVGGGVEGQYNNKNILYGTANTTKDANGNLKAASPVIKVYSDHIELNDESEGVELEKLGTGRYKLKGTLGMNSDASWGGIHGGLVVPNGINNLPLVWADFDVLPDGDIIIETRYRKHTLHQQLEAQRLMTYPEFLDENNIEREDYDYCDIPNGHWIDVRVNMPSDSIYNQKLLEAERLAKIEAERVAKEEAEKMAQEDDGTGI
ncbi:hypothetical protein CO695_13040 [Providencia alcalifaciens]|nr:hypothetical protein [Providencia alcalifaciens]ATG17175.1 hypothetical protein CO695_13040 [Providencia alcalifaciens]SQI38037.1 Uncharacterised protein [Providencia alcalifaciens]